MELTREEILEALYHPKRPSSSVSLFSGKLIRDLKPPRTLRQWLREELLRRGRDDGKPGGEPGATA